jgi:hypothetical protein
MTSTLEYLYLNGTDVTDKGLKLIAQSLTKLKHLDISTSNLILVTPNNETNNAMQAGART